MTNKSVESDPLSRKALDVTVPKPFEMVTNIICKKVCDLTECGFIVACGVIVRSYPFYGKSIIYNFEQSGFR